MQRKMQLLLANHYKSTGVVLPSVGFKWLDSNTDKWSLEIFDVPVVSGNVTNYASTSEIADVGMLGRTSAQS